MQSRRAVARTNGRRHRRRGAAKYPELKVIFKDAQNDTLQQRAQVEEFVSAKVDLLIISPKEAQPLTEPVAHAMAAGIPVIVLDRRLLGTNYTCFIGADNRKIGKAAGEWITKTLGGKGNVVELMGLQTSTPGQDRHSGFLEGIAGSNIKIRSQRGYAMARTERASGNGVSPFTFRQN